MPTPKHDNKDVADTGSSESSVVDDAVLSIDSGFRPVNEDTTMKRSASWYADHNHTWLLTFTKLFMSRSRRSSSMFDRGAAAVTVSRTTGWISSITASQQWWEQG